MLDTQEEKTPHGTQLIARVAKVLRALPHGSASGRRLREIAHATQLTEPTVRRILAALVREQFVSKDEASKRYRLGPIAFELGLASGYQERFIERCQAIVEHVAAESGDTTTFVKRSGVEAICLIEKSGSYPIHVRLEDVGLRFPLGVSTGGVALLSGLDASEVDDILANELFATAPLSPARIRERVENARRLGYADISDIPMPGVRGIGILVPSASGQPTFAITVAAVQSRLTDDRVEGILALLREASARIAEELRNL